MRQDLKDPLGEKTILKRLLGLNLISEKHAREIMIKKEHLKEALELDQAKRNRVKRPHERIRSEISFIDILASQKYPRNDSAGGVLDEDMIYETLAAFWQVPYKKIDPLKLDLNLVTTTIPRQFAMTHLVLPVERHQDDLVVATPNPFNREAFEDITRVSNLHVTPVVTSKGEVLQLMNEFFGFKRSISAAEDLFASPMVDIGNLEQYVKLKADEELPSTDQHIVNAVNHILLYAFDQRASDVHIEPKREHMHVRMRIDGVLHTVYKLPRKVHNPMVSRIKTLSRLDIAEKRRPQDGRIKTDKGGVEVEIRISTVPVAFGEKVVMRIMDPEILFMDLSDLGFTTIDLEHYKRFVSKPNGIVLVCGPTGSGKTTTLYSTLRTVASSEKNIITVEDPIEMIHEEFNQIGVQPAVDVYFDTLLRSILRQDPDIIMIGEMRDLDTAQSAVQSALTGHLVLSTLHTNDAPSAITRLLDVGVPSYLITATLEGVLAQRLIRKVCKYCEESFEIRAEELIGMGLDMKQTGLVKLKRGVGCIRCRGTGYRGRIGVFEVLPMTDSIRKMTRPRTNIENIRIRAREEGMRTLRESATAKMMLGVTTYQEVLNVTWQV